MERHIAHWVTSLALGLALLAGGCGGKKDSGCKTRDDCATGEVCDDGKCVAGECVEDSDCAPRVCEDHLCVDCRVAADCDDQIACTTDTCSVNGDCVHTPNHSDCDDSVPCTVDTCDATSGCLNQPDDAACDDSVPCTVDTCDATEGCLNAPSDALCDDQVGCTVDTCDATEGCLNTPSDALCDDQVGCTTDTCDAENDCQHVPVDSICDDGWDCTVDTCDEETGCLNTPDHGSCADAVDCTDDLCDPTAGAADAHGCTVTPNDANCAAQECNTVSCHITGGCLYTPVPDFDVCGTNGVCYNGTCITGVSTALTPPSHACAQSAWAPKEAIWNGTVGLAVLWDYTTSILLNCPSPQPYTQIMAVDTTTGAMSAVGDRAWGRGKDLLDTIVVGTEGTSTTRITGTVNWASPSVDWSAGNWLATALSTMGSTHQFHTLAMHSQGSIMNPTRHYWLQASSQVVRCTYVPEPCIPSCPTPVCYLHSTAVDMSWGELAPYTASSSLNIVYAGVMSPSTPSAGTVRNIWCDGTNKDYNLSSIAYTGTSTIWRGMTRYAASSYLAYGTGSGPNLVQCTDEGNTGMATCAEITGLPNQATTGFIDGASGYSGGAVLLGTRCAMDPCITSTYSLYVLSPGADPTVAANWTVLALGTMSSMAGPTQVVSGPDGFHAVGLNNSGEPTLWSWAP